MAYTKHTWVTGETITAANLNHLEDGVVAVSANGAIGTANLADGAVTTMKIQDNAVNVNKIADVSITSAKIDYGAVETDNIASNAVTSAKIADGAVTNAKIATAAVSGTQIADETITATNIADETLTEAKLDPTFAASLAKVDGSYELLTSGNAEQLVSTVGVENNAPYVFRTTGGAADVGDRMNLKAVVGGTVAWNQLCEHGDFDAATGWSSGFTVSGGVASATYSSTGSFNSAISRSASIIDGHKYLVYARYKCTSANRIRVRYPFVGSGKNTTANTWEDFYWIAQNSGTGNIGIQTDSINGETSSYKYIMCIDLTAMFGSAIADYAYTLESNTAGAGVAWLKSYGFFTKPYYPYAAANLQSVKTSAHKMVGRNAYNPTTGTAKLLGGYQYEIFGTYSSVSYTDIDGNIETLTFTDVTVNNVATKRFTPTNNGTLTVTGGDSTSTCVALVWDGEKAGIYEPYAAHEYALDDIILRGILKLDANNNLHYDGDEYTPDGTVTRRYKYLDLGTLNWVKSSSGNKFTGTIPSAYAYPHVFGLKMVCAAYTFDGNGNSSRGYYGDDKTLRYFFNSASDNSCEIYIHDEAYSTKAAFASAMNGVYLVYELATPTTESADAYTELQICNDFGTEEFVDAATRDFDMPVGNVAVYAPNLRAKVEMAPDSPDGGDGDYIVRQTNGTNEYVALSDNSIVSGLTTRCPACPTDTDGTFVLKATVSGGAVTYSWVSE